MQVEGLLVALHVSVEHNVCVAREEGATFVVRAALGRELLDAPDFNADLTQWGKIKPYRQVEMKGQTWSPAPLNSTSLSAAA